MRTNVVLSDGRSLRAHFMHYSKDRYFICEWYSILRNIIEKSFENGDIKQYVKQDRDPHSKSLFGVKHLTVCELTLPEKDQSTQNHKLICFGTSFCSPKDQFCKARGRKIAFNRAIKSLKSKGFEIQSVQFV